ncbi:TPA: hypothetical protein N0F65_006907 [Lagenidium giganteum]|uniref:HECT-type E3 ubiquitin transferase n=1 Tax=Lagenidium giganteum TaxID=4803 RepID=A0AAV2ZH18_9STRA|nr:TPA: hypothetical protein N0F65_006907 [Lagenidium giganteum]
MEIFLALMALVVLFLMVGGLYLLKDQSRAQSEQLTRTYLSRVLLAENEAITRLDLERNQQADERWKCLVCDFANSMEKRTCLLCGTRRNATRRVTGSNPTELDEKAKFTGSSNSSNSGYSSANSSSNRSTSQRMNGPQANVRSQSLRLSVLNPRQRYARKRMEWVRKVGSDGSAFWVRQNLLPRSSTTSTIEGNARASVGFVTCLVRSSIESCGRLTFAESAHADATATMGGYQIAKEELELIDRISRLPFQSKYAWFLERMGALLRNWEDGRIKLCVHRENVLVESMEQLLGIQLEHIHYPMRIEFVGEVGIDAGGLQREWFAILFSKLLDDSLGLFMLCHRNNQSVCINPNSIECTSDHLLYFRGIGRLIGRALLEGHIMHARLALPILKHILGVPVTFSDLMYVDPEVYNSMKWIRDNSDVDALDLTFSVTECRDGGAYVIDLVPGGRDVPVTDENKQEYLQLRLRYLMLDRYKDQLHALSMGLFEVIPQENLMVFDYQELELVLCGMPEIDVQDWRRHTTVASNLAGAPIIEWFWEIVAQLSEEDRARFLQFCTGSSRVPVQGFKGLTSYDGRICPFTIRSLPNQTAGFPKVHTCFNRIELPLYSTKEELRVAICTVLEMDFTEFNDE